MHRRAITYTIAGAILLVPSFVFAQFPDQLVPCTGPGDCDACALVTLGQNILNFLVALSVFVAVLAFTYAGFLMVTAAGNEAQVTKAKSTFSAVMIGFIIVLAAWLIINLLLSVLTGKGVESWSGVLCDGGDQQLGIDIDVDVDPPGEEGVVPGETPDVPKFSHAEAEQTLAEKGISVKPGASLEGINQNTVNEAVRLAEECGCSLVVTEGTGGTHEPGEKSHANGYKLDIRTRDNPRLIEHIESLPKGQVWSDGTQTYIHPERSIEYALESDHLDVAVLSG